MAATESGRMDVHPRAARLFALANSSPLALAEYGMDRRIRLVSGDGGGGADPEKGSGLRGRTDRVEELGGSLEIHSPPGAGTRLRATIPSRPRGG